MKHDLMEVVVEAVQAGLHGSLMLVVFGVIVRGAWELLGAGWLLGCCLGGFGVGIVSWLLGED